MTQNHPLPTKMLSLGLLFSFKDNAEPQINMRNLPLHGHYKHNLYYLVNYLFQMVWSDVCAK